MTTLTWAIAVSIFVVTLLIAVRDVRSLPREHRAEAAAMAIFTWGVVIPCSTILFALLMGAR